MEYFDEGPIYDGLLLPNDEIEGVAYRVHRARSQDLIALLLAVRAAHRVPEKS